MVKRMASVALLALMTASTDAQQAPEDETTKPAVAEEAAPAAADEAKDATVAEPAGEPEKPEPGRATMERFKPSEEISDDRSVSFPNDI